MCALGARAALTTVADRLEAHLADRLERTRVPQEALPAELVRVLAVGTAARSRKAD
jgi:hypothetical protein